MSKNLAPSLTAPKGLTMKTEAKYWCFTLNNYTADDLDHIKGPVLDKLSYLIFQYELAPTTGTPHLQGYLELSNKRTLSSLIKLFKDGGHQAPHIDLRNAKDSVAPIAYCKKPESRDPKFSQNPFFEKGTPFVKEQGKRTDLNVIKEDVNKISKDNFIEQHPIVYSRNRHSMDHLYNKKISNLVRPIPKVHVRWGKPGTGKTRYIHDNFKAHEIYVQCATSSDGKPWFNGYDPENHKVVLFDEFKGRIKIDLFLQFLDRYQVQVETKGGMVSFAPKYIFITSNSHPLKWYDYVDDQYQAVYRRLLSISEIISDVSPIECLYEKNFQAGTVFKHDDDEQPDIPQVKLVDKVEQKKPNVVAKRKATKKVIKEFNYLIM